MTLIKSACAGIGLLVIGLAIASQQPKRIVSIRRATYAPVLTGTLTNPVWRDATVFTDFHMLQPHQGPPSDRMAVYLMNDKDNIYVGLRLFDRQPDQIRIEGSTGDHAAQNDSAEICFDPTPDHRKAFFFFTTPGDAHLGGSLDASDKHQPAANIEWTSKARKVPGGWIAEMAIPFKSLGVTLKDQLQMSFKASRHVGRTGEVDSGPGQLSETSPEFGQYTEIRFQLPHAEK